MHTLLEGLVFHFGRLFFLICQLIKLAKKRDTTSCEVDAIAKSIHACCFLFLMALGDLVETVWNDDTLVDKICVLQKQVVEQETELYNRNWVQYTNCIIKEAEMAEMAREPDPTHPDKLHAAAVILQRATRSFLARKKQAKYCELQSQQRPASQAGPPDKDSTPPVLPGRDGDGNLPLSPERPTNSPSQPSGGGGDPPVSPGCDGDGNPSTQLSGRTNLPQKKVNPDKGNGGDDGDDDGDDMDKRGRSSNSNGSNSDDKDKGAASNSRSDKGKGSGSVTNAEGLMAITTLQRLSQMNLSATDIEAIEDIIAALRSEFDELSDEERDSDTPPSCTCEEIAILKAAVELLRKAQQCIIGKEELKKGIDSFFMLMEPYGILVDELVKEKEEKIEKEQKEIKQLQGEQKFSVRNKTLGAALSSCMGTVTKNVASKSRRVESSNVIIDNAMKATGSSSKTDLASRLRLNYPLRNVLQYLLNLRAMIEVLEGVQFDDIIINKEEQMVFLSLTEKEARSGCTLMNFDASKYVFEVVLPCSPAHSDLKVRVVRVLIEALRKIKKNDKLKGAFGRAAGLNITTGEYEGSNNYFEGNYNRVKYATTTLLILLLSEEADKQIVSLDIVPNKIDVLSSVCRSALTTMEHASNFMLKDQFWAGKFDEGKATRSKTKISEEDMIKKLKKICTNADKSPKDLRGKDILMHVSKQYLQALIRIRDVCRAR